MVLACRGICTRPQSLVFEMDYVRNVEVADLLTGKLAPLNALSIARGMTTDVVRSELATNILALRMYPSLLQY